MIQHQHFDYEFNAYLIKLYNLVHGTNLVSVQQIYEYEITNHDDPYYMISVWYECIDWVKWQFAIQEQNEWFMEHFWELQNASYYEQFVELHEQIIKAIKQLN